VVAIITDKINQGRRNCNCSFDATDELEEFLTLASKMELQTTFEDLKTTKMMYDDC
jgi:hypothetical protein